MSWDSLKARCGTLLGVDLDDHLVAFQQATESGDLDLFVAYLLKRGAITREDCLAIYARNATTIAAASDVPDGGHKRVDATLDLGRKHTEKTATCTIIDSERSTVVSSRTLRLNEAGAELERGQGSEPTVIGHRRSGYALLDRLAEGGLGEVYVARQSHLRRKVAYKSMSSQAASQPDLVSRFVTEAQLTAQLEHPNVVPIYTLEEQPDGRPAYAMKLVEGKDLTQLIAEIRERYEHDLPLERAHELSTRLEHFLDVCDAVAYAHSKGVIHRDLKPDNIMIGRYNELYVIDWGIARVVGRDDPHREESSHACGDATVLESGPDSRTLAGDVLGTPRYMSPEQASGLNDELDGASDLYTLGLILQELVTLRRATQPGSLRSVLSRARQGERERPVHFHTGERIPRELNAIITRATRRRREDRYPCVQALRDDVHRYLRGEATEALPDNLHRRVKRWIGRNQTLTLSLITLLLMAVSLGIIGGMLHQEALIERLHDEERRRTELVERVADRAHRIDNQLQSFQSLLHGLSASAAGVLAQPPVSDARAYFSETFDRKDTSPSDLIESPFYPRAISTTQPVVKLAPGVERDGVRSDISRALLLKPVLERVLLASQNARFRGNDPERARGVIVRGPPIRRAAVTLPEGVHLAYPGMGGYASSFDGRDMPHYILARFAPGGHWGRPFTEPGGRELMLPGAMAIRDVDGTFQGVASIELSLNHVARYLLDLEGLPGLREAMLVNRLGVTMVHTADDAAPGERSHFVPTAVLELIKRNDSGVVEVEGDEPAIIAFFPLQSVEWHYVAVVDRAEFMQADANGAWRGVPVTLELSSPQAR